MWWHTGVLIACQGAASSNGTYGPVHPPPSGGPVPLVPLAVCPELRIGLPPRRRGGA
jgi:hypothetical protein